MPMTCILNAEDNTAYRMTDVEADILVKRHPKLYKYINKHRWRLDGGKYGAISKLSGKLVVERGN